LREIRRVFVDENLLAVGTALDAISDYGEVFYPGHPQCPEIPLGAKDQEWLPIVGANGLDRFVITHDKKIRKKPAELISYRDHGVRALFFTNKKDLQPREYLLLLLQQWNKIDMLATSLGAGPWCMKLAPRTGPAQLALPDPERYPSSTNIGNQ